MNQNDLRTHAIAYLADATPILQESLTDFAAWQKRSPTERDQLTRLLHDWEVGEDWNADDSWADVTFSPEEIAAFSAHILVDGDDGLPEWYKVPPPSSVSLENPLFTPNTSHL